MIPSIGLGQKVFVKQHTYYPISIDTRESAKIIALWRVREELLSGMSKYLSHQIKSGNISLTKPQQKAFKANAREISVGLTKTKTLSRRANKNDFYIKEGMALDESQVATQIKKLLRNRPFLSDTKASALRAKEALQNIEKLQKSYKKLTNKLVKMRSSQDQKKPNQETLIALIKEEDDITKAYQKAVYDLAKEQYFYTSQKAYDGAIYDTVIRNMGYAIKVDDNISSFYTIRGKAFYQKAQLNEAIKDFDRAIQLDQNASDAFYYKGLVLQIKGDLDNALKSLNRALELDKNEKVYNTIAETYYKGRRFNQAIYGFSMAIQLDDSNPQYYYNRGNAYYDKSHLKPAITDYTKAIELDKDFAKAYLNRGAIFSELGELDRACKDALMAKKMGIDGLYNLLVQKSYCF